MLNFRQVKILFFDFDGVFTDNRVMTDINGNEYVTCYRSDGIGLSKLKLLEIPLYIVSTEKNNVVQKRAEKLNIPCINGVDNKLEVVMNILDKEGLMLSDALFCGNDINDLEVLEHVGFPVVVNDAYPEVIKIAKYVTTKIGGYGAVRELCDLVYEAKK